MKFIEINNRTQRLAAFIIISLLLISIGVCGLYSEYRIKQRWIKTQAKVVYFLNYTHETNNVSCPVVEFKVGDSIIKGRGKYSGSDILFDFKEGDTVDIYYNRKNASKFRIDGDYNPYFLWGIFIFIGLIFMVGSIIINSMF